jgi:hypothetical protein
MKCTRSCDDHFAMSIDSGGAPPANAFAFASTFANASDFGCGAFAGMPGP